MAKQNRTDPFGQMSTPRAALSMFVPLEMRLPESLYSGKILPLPAIIAHSGKQITLVIMLKNLLMF